MADIEPEEAEALLAGDAGGRDVRAIEPRDFSRPRRLSQGQREALETLVVALLPDARAELAELLGEGLALGLQSVGEVDARALFEGQEAVPCVLGFRIEEATGWAAWEAPMAVAAVESLLGGRSADGEARPFSELESGVLVELLAPLVRRMAAALGAEATDFSLHQSTEELRRAALAAGARDGHRLEIELSVELGEATSALRCYFPGFPPVTGRSSADGGTMAELPPPVRGVPVGLRARLAGCEVPLSQLLSLEVGDVIPLEDRADEPLVLFVEDERYATAKLGTHRGMLAVRIEHIEKERDA